MRSSYTELRVFGAIPPSDTNSEEPAPEGSGITLQTHGVQSLPQPLASQTCHQYNLDTPDTQGDRLLLGLCQQDDQGAFLCLRCRVSHELEWKARDLAQQFRPSGLDFHEIVAFVLLDDGDRRRRESLSYLALRQQQHETMPLSVQVICSYDPDRGAGLPHWAKFRLKCHKPLQDYLLKFHGLRIITDWALLKHSSATRMRQAWPFLTAPSSSSQRSLALEQVLALHDRYCRAYTNDRNEHYRRHGRRGGYVPSEQLLLTIQPDARPDQTYDVLRSMATAIRRSCSPAWKKQLALSSENDNDGAGVDLIETLADPRSLADADDDVAAIQLQQIRQALQRALDQHMPAVLAPASGDPQLLCLWHGFAAGLTTRAIAERCGCKQTFVSKQLKSRQHTSSVAQKAAAALSRQSAFAAVAASLEGLERIVTELTKQLRVTQPQPLEQEEGERLPTLQQWVQRHLPQS